MGNDVTLSIMISKPPPGLFITGTDTDVGKTYVAALIARSLAAHGLRVGVYKPAASGCRPEGDQLVSDDALALWNAAGQPADLEHVCPQRFAAPLAPHLAARAEGRELDMALLRSGLDYWRERSDVLLIEGAGGLMSPFGDEDYVADLAVDFHYPLLVVAPNQIGVINQTLQTLIVAMTFRDGLPIAGVVLNEAHPRPDDPSLATNLPELRLRCVPPVLGSLRHGQAGFDPAIDWLQIAKRPD